jgi:hypothetical protein
MTHPCSNFGHSPFFSHFDHGGSTADDDDEDNFSRIHPAAVRLYTTINYTIPDTMS